jgi:hypothetical protein
MNNLTKKELLDLILYKFESKQKKIKEPKIKEENIIIKHEEPKIIKEKNKLEKAQKLKEEKERIKDEKEYAERERLRKEYGRQINAKQYQENKIEYNKLKKYIRKENETGGIDKRTKAKYLDLKRLIKEYEEKIKEPKIKEENIIIKHEKPKIKEENIIIKHEEPKIKNLILKNDVEFPKPLAHKKNIDEVEDNIEDKIKKLEKLGKENGAQVYNPHTLISSFFYIYLLQKYEKKCAIITKDVKGLVIDNNGVNSETNKEFFNYAENLGNDLLDCIKRGEKIIAFPLVLQITNKKTKEIDGHANMMIFRPFQGIIERFEPHGSATIRDDRKFNEILEFMFEEKLEPYLGDYTPEYIAPQYICPKGEKMPEDLSPLQWDKAMMRTGLQGFQSIEGSLRGEQKENKGYCMLWSLFLLELVFINPSLSTKQVIDIALKTSNYDPQYLKNVIRGYLSEVEKILNDYLQKIDKAHSFNFAVGESFKKKKYIIQNELLHLLASFKSNNSQRKILEQEREEFKDIKNLLETKTESELNKMMLSIAHTIIPTDLKSEMIPIIISFLIDKKYKNLTKENIINYFENQGQEKGKGIKICKKIGKCKKVSQCRGIRI